VTETSGTSDAPWMGQETGKGQEIPAESTARVTDVLTSFQDVMEAVAASTRDQLQGVQTAGEGESTPVRPSVYGIGAIEVELAAGVQRDPEGDLILNFQPEPSLASRLRFTVEPVPMPADNGHPE
jgi:hypothetical protein